MKMCAAYSLGLIVDSQDARLMSDYDVKLVNDNMQEFHVLFHGPDESASRALPCLGP
jgi:hypothetical protein